MVNYSDAELVDRLQRRESAAVSVLLEQYADRLYNYAYYHSGNHHLAEDIVSETFTRIIEKIDTYVVRDVPFKAWVFRIAHNLLVDHFRQRNRQSAISLEAVDWENGAVATPASDWGAADGGALAEQVAEREDLRQAIMTLPEEQRTIFLLRFIEGLSLEEVAALQNKSLPSIKSLQYRAVKNLRRFLDGAKGNQIAAGEQPKEGTGNLGKQGEYL